jgi:hypothetical protein
MDERLKGRKKKFERSKNNPYLQCPEPQINQIYLRISRLQVAHGNKLAPFSFIAF